MLLFFYFKVDSIVVHGLVILLFVEFELLVDDFIYLFVSIVVFITERGCKFRQSTGF